MEYVKVKKEQVLAILKTNRTGHRDLFLKAQDGYRAKAIDLLDETLKDAREGRLFDLVKFYGMKLPEDHTREYDRAIGMLEMSVDDVIELQNQEYKNFIEDDWNWQAQATITNSGYANYQGSRHR